MSAHAPEIRPPTARAGRAFRVALFLLLTVALASAVPPQSAAERFDRNSRFEAELSAREAEMGRTVSAGQRPAVLARMAGHEEPNTIGDTSADLVYTPLSPCRVVDTRVPTAGILSVGVPRPFIVAGDSAAFPSQGGRTGGCDVPVGATAAMLNLVATDSTGPGNLRAIAWASGTPVMPKAAVINFGAVSGLPALSNGLAVPICDPASTACTYDIYVQTYVSSTHFVADVVGYFSSVNGVVTSAQAPLEVLGSSVRMSSTGCAAGSVWKWTGSAWSCSPDANTTYTGGAGVSVSGSTIGLSSSGCGTGYVWKWNGSAWSCSSDANTLYSAGTGLTLSGTTFSVNPSALGRSPVLSWYDSWSSGFPVTWLQSSWTSILSASVTAPPGVAGSVLAIATSDLQCFNNCVKMSVLQILTDVAGGQNGVKTTDYLVSADSPVVHPTLLSVFPVGAGATKTVYWRGLVYGWVTWGDVGVFNPKIVLTFVPN